MNYSFLLDECMSPSLEGVLWSYGIDTVHVRSRGMLGAPDHILWRYAVEQERALVTINSIDFKKLAAMTPKHSGVIAIPSGGGRDAQHGYVRAGVEWAAGANYPSISPFANRFIEVSSINERITVNVSLSFSPPSDEADQ